MTSRLTGPGMVAFVSLVAVLRVVSIAPAQAPEPLKPAVNTSPKIRLEVQRGHTGDVRALCYSADSTKIASGGTDKTIKIWDASSGTLLRTLPTDTAIKSLAFSPNGELLASGSGQWSDWPDQRITLWDVSSGQAKAVLKPAARSITSVAFSSDGKALLCGSDSGTVQKFDLQRIGERQTSDSEYVSLWIVPGPGGVSSTSTWGHAAFSPTGEVFVICHVRDITLHDTASGKALKTLQWPVSERAEYADFSADGTLLTIVGREDVVVYETATWQILSHARVYDYYLRSGAITAGESPLAAVAGDRFLRLLNAKTGAQLFQLKGSDGGVGQAIAFAPNGETVAHAGQDASIRVWNTANGTMERWMPSSGAGVSSLVFAQDILAALSGFPEHTIRLWNVSTRALTQTIPVETTIFKLSLSPDARIVATGTQDRSIYNGPGEVRLWQTQSGHLLHALQGHRYYVGAVAFAPDGRTIASGSGDRRIRFWNVASGKLLGTLTQGFTEGSNVDTIAYSPDGKTLASGSRNGIIRLWKRRAGNPSLYRPRHVLKAESPVQALVFAENGKTLLSGGMDYYNKEKGHNVLVWDVASGRRKGRLSQGSPVTALAASSQSAVVAAGSADGIIALWNVTNGFASRKPVRHLKADQPIQSLAFLSEGKVVVSGHRDNSIMFWNARSGQILATLHLLPGEIEGESSREWVIHTPQGYYDASARAEKFIRWRVGTQLYPAAFGEKFHQPELVQKALLNQ